MAVELSLLVSVAVMAATWMFLRWWNRTRRLPPGPWGLPLLGYYPFLASLTTDFSKLSAKYGPVFSFRTVGGKLFVVLNGASTIREVLVHRGDEFIGRIKENNLVSWMSNGMGILQEEGETWREHRKFFLQTAKNLGFAKPEMEVVIHEEVRRMLADIRAEGQTDVRLLPHVAYVTNSAISRFLFAKKFEKDESFKRNLSNMVEMIDTFVGRQNVLVGFAHDLLHHVFRSLDRCKKDLRKFTDSVLADHMLTYDPDRPRGYVDHFLAHAERLTTAGKKDGGSFTKTRLSAILVNMILEGSESTGNTITGLLLELSRHQTVQEKIQAELERVVGLERLPTWADRVEMPYLDAVIQELYRMKSRFVVSSIYSNSKEATLHGFLIPERTAILANMHSVHFDPQNFPDPEKFDPNRFLDSEGRRIKRDGPYPFGIGKRACVAEPMAQMEVFIVIGSVMQSFTLRPGTEEGTVRALPRTSVDSPMTRGDNYSLCRSG